MCDACIKPLQEKNFEKHKKCKAQLKITGEKLSCELCQKLKEPQNKKAHLQSQESNTKTKEIEKFV